MFFQDHFISTEISQKSKKILKKSLFKRLFKRKGKKFNETGTHFSNPYWNINTVLVGSSGRLVIITILAIRFRSKLWELKDNKCIIPIKYFWEIVLILLKFLDGCVL